MFFRMPEIPPVDSSSRIELAGAVRFIARFWLREVDHIELERLRDPEIRTALTADRLLDGWLSENSSNDEDLVDELAAEYCQLLVGPRGHLSPVESVNVANQFQGEPAAAMQRYFDLLSGYSPPSSLPDHIGVQLDFVAALLVSNVQVSNHNRDGENQDGEKRERDERVVDEIVQRFVSERLAWSSDFFEQVESRSRESGFYRWLARTSIGLVASLRS